MAGGTARASRFPAGRLASGGGDYTATPARGPGRTPGLWPCCRVSSRPPPLRGAPWSSAAWPTCSPSFLWPVPSLARLSALALWSWRGELLCWSKALLGHRAEVSRPQHAGPQQSGSGGLCCHARARPGQGGREWRQPRLPPRTSLSIPRDNLSQWEKVLRGEETAVWISSQPVDPGTSEKLPLKIDD